MVASATCPATLGHDSPTDYAHEGMLLSLQEAEPFAGRVAVRATYNMPPKAALNAKAHFSAQGRRNSA